MYQLLYKYLVLYRSVNIPGVGRFKIEQQPAKFDVSTRTIHAPAENFIFTTQTTLADRKFYHFLCRELQINEVDAVKQFQAFTDELKANLKQHNAVTLPGIGTLNHAIDGDIVFDADTSSQAFFPDTKTPDTSAHFSNQLKPQQEQIEDTIEEKFEHQIEGEELLEMGETKTDYWWLWAIVLGLAGAVAIYYYYTYMA